MCVVSMNRDVSVVRNRTLRRERMFKSTLMSIYVSFTFDSYSNYMHKEVIRALT